MERRAVTKKFRRRTEMSSSGKQASGYAYCQERRGRLNERVNICRWHLQVFAPDYLRPWINPLDKNRKEKSLSPISVASSSVSPPPLATLRAKETWNLWIVKKYGLWKNVSNVSGVKNAREIQILLMDLSRMGSSGRLRFAAGQTPRRKGESGWRGKGGGDLHTCSHGQKSCTVNEASKP